MDEKTLYTAQTVILGIGNLILSDEGFGVRVLEELAARYDFPDGVSLVDGGTLGIELTQYVTGAERLLIIDSINGMAPPGTIFRFKDEEVLSHFQEKISAHEVGIQDVLALLNVTGKQIPHVTVVGVQPFRIEAGVGLTPQMLSSVPKIIDMVLRELKAWGITPTPKKTPQKVDYTKIAEVGYETIHS